MARYGVKLERSSRAFRISGSRQNFAQTTAVAPKSITCPRPTRPIPMVLPRMIVRGLVEVTRVSIILEVFSVVMELETWKAQK